MATSSVAATNNINTQKVMKTLKDAASTSDSKIQALTSFRRKYIEDQKIMKTMKDEEFCELCNSVINASVTEDDNLHIEACRTLDIILPETKTRNFDFFQSILQINRKKRLKVLVSLSILKDETVAIVASKLSILNFLNDCIESIQPTIMTWLLPENADNGALLKNIENKTLSESEDFEEKVVERMMQLLNRLINLSSSGLNIRQFDTFIMDKVLPLAYMGHKRQRSTALVVLQQAVKNDLGIRVRSIQKEIWEKYKNTLQSVYCKRMTLLVNSSDQDWATQWETSITLIGVDLHRGSGLVNSLLKVEEFAFKSADPNRRQAFLSWKLLIDNFALDQRELATNRRIKLLCVPLNAKNSKTELMVLTKLEVWWHLINKVYPSLAGFIDAIMVPFLNLCFGPFGDKPLFIQKTELNVSLAKKFTKTQIFAVDAFLQLIISKEDQSKIVSSTVQEKLPGPISDSVFQVIYKMCIHSFGECVIILSQLTDEEYKNKTGVCKILWDNLIKRINEYDKFKITMYKELTSVITELSKNRFHKLTFVRDFLLNIFLKNSENIAFSMHFNEHMLMDLIQTILQVDNFSSFISDHYQSIESLLWHLIKPQNADVYYPQTLELMQAILKTLEDARKFNSHMFSACEIWSVLAKIAKKYAEDAQNINEGTQLEHNFKTIESILAFPFTSLFTEDHDQLKRMAEAWIDLYKQFDFQAELIVTVKPNEIIDKTSHMIVNALKKDKQCCDFATICADVLLNTVNYDNLPNDKEVPVFVQLLKDLTFQCLRSNSFTTERILKALSSFLLRVFSHSAEKAALYLKNIEPAVRYMLAKVDDVNDVEQEIASTWSTIVNLFKKLQKSLNYELLNSYRKTIILAMLHLNKDISSMAFSILDLKDSIDEKSKKLMEEIINELEETSVKNNFDLEELKGKTKKIKSPHIKPIGSFLNRKSTSPSRTVILQNGKENVEKAKIVNIEPDSQDFVVINTDIKLDVNRLTEHQKEMLKKRRDDIPAMYNDLTVSNSQDSQELQRWFDAKMKPSTVNKKIETPINNNEVKTTATSFTNIAQVFAEPPKPIEKPAISTVTSPKSQPKKQSAKADEHDGDVSTIEDSQKEGISNKVNVQPTTTAAAPIVAKKLDFESQEEFPAAEIEQTSPSMIDNKMRRRTINEDNSANAGSAVPDKNVRLTRRSFGNLRRSNSSEQLNKRGKKRRNSESNSEGMLDIEREKRPKRADTPETLDSSSLKLNEESKSAENTDGKKSLSKRQLNEMSRLKIDMRFEPLPNRRSVGKSTVGESNTPSITDKKSATTVNTTDKKSALTAGTNEKKTTTPANVTDKKAAISATATDKKVPVSVTTNDKKASTSANTDKKAIATKDEKPKDEKTSSSKTESNSQQSQPTSTIKRRSMKSTVAIVEKESSPSKDSGIKKPDNSETTHKLTTRRSLPAKLEKAREIEETQTQESMDVEENTTQENVADKIDDSAANKSSTVEEDKTDESESQSSQDSDIVESSQEPTNSKLDKVECFIKIKKMEISPNPKSSEEITKDEPKIIAATPDFDETTISIIPATIEPDKPPPVQQESKKVENNPAKPTVPVNQTSSPKSANARFFRSKAFPLQGRAAQMLGLVTKQALAENSKIDTSILDEVTIVPIPKKDKTLKEGDKISSPSGGSRQEKMFSNLNNSMRQEMCSSPSMTMFGNLKIDGERFSMSMPELNKHERENEVECFSIDKDGSQTEADDSPGKSRKELPMLEWSNANPPSLTASPSASILKRMQEYDADTPNRKKRVSFADPPVSREMGYEIMTESSSPPRLEKLPSTRSPVSRKDAIFSKCVARLRRMRMVDNERLEKENENCQIYNAGEKSQESIIDERTTINISSDVSITVAPKIKLATVLTELSMEESRKVETDNKVNENNTQDVDIFIESNNVSANDESTDGIKTSTQNEPNNSSIKLDSINLSNILQKSDSHTSQNSLEDTVDANNISSSIEGTSNLSDKSIANYSQQISEAADTLPVTDSVFSNLPISQETQNSVAQLNEPENLDSTLPVYPSLTSCNETVDVVSADLVDPLFTSHLAKHLSVKSIRSVGDLAQLTERDINRLPIKSPKVPCVKKALSKYQEKMMSRTPERKPSNTVSSSTPLGNRRRDRSKTDSNSFVDFMKSGINHIDLPPINLVPSIDIYAERVKRHSTDSSMQTSPMKKVKKNDEELCAELMDQCDDKFLFEAFIKRYDAEKILKGYKEKMNDKTEKELKKETLNILGLSTEDDSEASFKASSKCAGLQKVLQLLPKVFDVGDEFMDTVLKAYKKKLKAETVIEMLKPNEFKESIVDKLSSSEILNILAKRLQQEKEMDVDESISDSNDLKVLLDRISHDSIINHVKTRNDLKSSEALLNVTLDNVTEKLSENTKRTMFKTLTEKLDVCELADMYHETIKSKLRKIEDK